MEVPVSLLPLCPPDTELLVFGRLCSVNGRRAVLEDLSSGERAEFEIEGLEDIPEDLYLPACAGGVREADGSLRVRELRLVEDSQMLRMLTERGLLATFEAQARRGVKVYLSRLKPRAGQQA